MIDIDANTGYDLNDFVIPTHYKDDLSRVLIPYGIIQDRVAKLAEDISKDCINPVVACCVLKGAHVFFAHLIEHLKKSKGPSGGSIPLSFEFLKVKSYHNDQSTGKVQISLSEDELASFKGKDILVFIHFI